MIARLATLLLLLSAWLCGCRNHLLFVEGSHIGLKAKVAPEGTSPVELDLGYRRGIVAVLPKREEPEPTAKPCETCTRAEASDEPIKIEDDAQELMSMYTVFRANVGFGDPTSVCHFAATGRAAAYLAASGAKLKALGDELCDLEPKKTGDKE